MTTGSASTMPPFLRYGPLLALLLGLFSSKGISQTLPTPVTTFDPDDYDAHPQVFCGEPLPDGRTAFGTSRVLLLHDGESFRHVPVGAGKAVFSMDGSPSGRLFLGGESLMGVVVPDSTGSPTYRSLLPLLPDSLKDFGIVWETVCTGEGRVYFNAYDHLFLYERDTVRVLRPLNRFYGMQTPGPHPVIQDRDTGLFALDGTGRTYLPGSRGLTKGKEIMAIQPVEEEGRWLVFTRHHGIHRYDPGKGSYRPLSVEGEGVDWRSAVIYTACRLDPNKNPYGAAYAVGTLHEGVQLLSREGRPLLHLGKEEGIPAKAIWQLAPDGKGNLWAATNNGIALVHLSLPFTMAEEGGLFSGGVQDITRPEALRSPLFLATQQGTWRWREGEKTFSLVPGTEGQCMDLLPWPPSNGRSPASSGSVKEMNLLVAGAHSGLLSFALPGTPGASPHMADTVPSDHAYCLAPLTSKGNGPPPVLVGGRGGLQVLTPEALKGQGEADPLHSVKDVPEGISSVGVVPEGRDSLTLWAGMSSKGLLKVTVDTAFTGQKTIRYDTTDGLPEGGIWVFPEPEGEGVVFGTDSGLFEFREGRFFPCCRYGELFCDGGHYVFEMSKGKNGEVWIQDGTGGRVKHLIPEGEGYRIDSTIFRALDLGTVRAIHPEEGRTWIGGDQGLACYHEGVDKDLDTEWHCLVRKVVGMGDSVLFGGAFREKVAWRPEGRRAGTEKDSVLEGVLGHVRVDEQPKAMVPELPYSENGLEFHYAAPFPDRQEKVRYAYRLEGFDTAWSKWTERTRKEYTNLPEGEYTFKVKARNVYLKESTTAKYRFRILPPWYRTSLAYAGYGTTGILTLALIVWLWVRKRRADRRAKEYLEGLEKANVEIREEKEKVEEQQKETEKQKEKVEEQQKETQKQKEKVEEAHAEITQSIAYAQKIQYALLQSEEHVSSHLPEHFILFKPQSQVSGDFYWAQEHKGYFYIAAVDCTGHGVPGAFMSMLGISQLNEIMNTEEVLTPGYILTDLRDRVARELRGSDPESAAKDGMDAAMVRIPLGNSNSNSNSKEEGMEVQFAGAQNPLYVIRKGIAEAPPSASMEYQGESVDGNPVKPFKKSSDGIEIKGDGQPVGYDEYAKEAFTTVSLKLQKGDMLYFFSDGYADQFGGPKGKKFRYGPFKQLLATLHEKPLEEQKQELDKTFEDWKAESNQEQIDDVVVVGVRV